MNAKQKALELLIMFEKVEGKILQEYLPSSFKKAAKASALICVEEIKQVVKEIEPSIHDWKHSYWEDVKAEINSL